MAFSKITNADFNNKGALSLPDQPTIAAQELKRKFDEDAREVVAPAFNKLVETELPDTSAAANIGATAPSPRTGNTIQAVMNSISSDLSTLEASVASAIAHDHTHSNKALLDTYTQTEADLAQAVADDHTHSNKTLLDSYTQTETDLADAVSKKHDHSNKTLLDKLSDVGGKLNYDGDEVLEDAYTQVKVTNSGASTTITASGKAELELEAGANVTLTTSGSKVTIASSGGGGGGTSYTAKDGVKISGTDIMADLKSATPGSEAAAAYGSTANRTYAVGLDTNKNLAVNIPLSLAALSGSYGDLQNKPTIPAAQVNSDWNSNSGVSEILNKPTIPTISVSHDGTATTTTVRKQKITINGTAYDVDGSMYMEGTANSASFAFTNASILTTSAIDVWTDTWGDNPSNVEVPSAGTCNVTFSAAKTRTVRIYIK